MNVEGKILFKFWKLVRVLFEELDFYGMKEVKE